MLSDINEKQVDLNGRNAYILNYITKTVNETNELELNITQIVFTDEDNQVYILNIAVMNQYYNEYQVNNTF